MTVLLWTILWQTALVGLVAGGMGWWLRNQPAALRHRLYLGALLLAALLPVASMAIRLKLPSAPGAGGATVRVTAQVPARAAAGAGAPLGGAPWRLPGLGFALGCLWAGAVLLQAAGLARRTWRARRAWRAAAPARVVAGVTVLRGQGGCFTVGWLRPCIVLPAALLANEVWSTAALAHELAHVRRRDYLWTWLGELTLLPLAWHPAARWLARQAALECEAACDEVARAEDACYPAHLVDIAAALHVAAAPPAGLCLARRRGFEQRIAWLMAPAPQRSHARAAVAVFGLSIAVAAAWALGGGVRRAPANAGNAWQVPAAAPQHASAQVTAASCISCAAPAYPPAARAAGVQGSVEMHVQIGKDGTVAAINCSIGNPELVAAAQAAVRGWRYHPLRLNGQPQSISTTVTTTFELERGPRLPMVAGLRGVVCDDAGARVAGAVVVATALTGGVVSRTATAPDGSFALALPQGQYTVAIQKTGFRSLRQHLTLPLKHPWLFVLSLGSATQNVRVIGRRRPR